VYRAIIAYRTHTDRDTCPLGLTARLLWANLASRADWDGTCSVAMETLRLALGAVNRATVQRATAELIEYGVIDVVVAHGRGRRNTYRMELAPDVNAARTRRLPACGQLENAALVHENAAPDASLLGEVVREVEESKRVRHVTINTPPGRALRKGEMLTCRRCRRGDDCDLCHGRGYVFAEEVMDVAP
jgi:hypothetical protein